MMRAWGGGLPETDDFYELCDKYGIMVIQEWPTAWNSHNTQTVRYVTGDGSEEYETYPKPPFFGYVGRR